MRLLVADLQVELGESEMLAERAREGAGKFRRVERQRPAPAGIAAGHDVERAILDIAFVIDEEEQLVLDDRAAERGAELVALQVDLVCRRASGRNRGSISPVFWKVPNASPWNSLVPDLVIAVMIAVPASSYSALKLEVRTRNSCTASCEKGLPRLTS